MGTDGEEIMCKNIPQKKKIPANKFLKFETNIEMLYSKSHIPNNKIIILQTNTP